MCSTPQEICTYLVNCSGPNPLGVFIITTTKQSITKLCAYQVLHVVHTSIFILILCKFSCLKINKNILTCMEANVYFSKSGLPSRHRKRVSNVIKYNIIFNVIKQTLIQNLHQIYTQSFFLNCELWVLFGVFWKNWPFCTVTWHCKLHLFHWHNLQSSVVLQPCYICRHLALTTS